MVSTAFARRGRGPAVGFLLLVGFGTASACGSSPCAARNDGSECICDPDLNSLSNRPDPHAVDACDQTFSGGSVCCSSNGTGCFCQPWICTGSQGACRCTWLA